LKNWIRVALAPGVIHQSLVMRMKEHPRPSCCEGAYAIVVRDERMFGGIAIKGRYRRVQEMKRSGCGKGSARALGSAQGKCAKSYRLEIRRLVAIFG
jgi:hypothetical protein